MDCLPPASRRPRSEATLVATPLPTSAARSAKDFCRRGSLKFGLPKPCMPLGGAAPWEPPLAPPRPPWKPPAMLPSALDTPAASCGMPRPAAPAPSSAGSEPKPRIRPASMELCGSCSELKIASSASFAASRTRL